MADRRIAPGKTVLYAVCLAGIVAGLALWAAPGRPSQAPAEARAVALPDTLALEVRYAGIDSTGSDMVWRARAGGPLAGLVTIRMDYAGDPADRGMPIWPVNVQLVFSPEDSRGSFAAELSGTMSWRTGEMRVAGLVTDGARVDTAVEQRMRLTQPRLDGRAKVVFYPRVARSP